ncbi:lysophospholipid acyltransferase family protein [Rhodopila sp.]|uniref:lysophospholipid acyltransferase family protein n=1 Tax=Rhodopila sp. TaxID=2480087 RepID=UPI002C399409|nr:lysophospholipid acyltransferase family protein [Rhodopila sp.]HVZ07082.1 lysophospholipid acyltransferase family protein [Rhodopila sp.]
MPEDHTPNFLLALPTHRDGWLVARRIRVVRRLLAVVAWTLPCMAIQGVLLMMKGHARIRFPRFFWAVFARLLGLEVRVLGQQASGALRPVLFVSNHSSWVDIPVLGGVLTASFVSKGEVAGWPVVGSIARLGRTVFVSRSRTATGRERDDMRGRMQAGDNLILFPEGTSSDGSRVLPFRSAFFSAVQPRPGDRPEATPLIQPVSVVYDRLGGLPAGRASRPIFAWYGDMDIATHFWRLGQYTGLRATVLLHPPIDPSAFTDRKTLSQAVWQVVADGASLLRQNRSPTDVAPAATAGAAGAGDPGDGSSDGMVYA